MSLTAHFFLPAHRCCPAGPWAALSHHWREFTAPPLLFLLAAEVQFVSNTNWKWGDVLLKVLSVLCTWLWLQLQQNLRCTGVGFSLDKRLLELVWNFWSSVFFQKHQIVESKFLRQKVHFKKFPISVKTNGMRNSSWLIGLLGFFFMDPLYFTFKGRLLNFSSSVFETAVAASSNFHFSDP